jgi:hypothetical protein
MQWIGWPSENLDTGRLESIMRNDVLRTSVLRVALLAVVARTAASGGAPDYAARRASAIHACEAIDRGKYQTGLFLNPDGYRSFYLRSECFQQAAVMFRDDALCAHVKQRHSLLSSSWGYSPSHCRDLVRDGLDADQKELNAVKQLYLAGPLRMHAFRIERNGNGRDFDIIPTFTGAYAHGYQLTFEILDPDGQRPPVTLLSDGYYVEPAAVMRLFVRQSELRLRMPDLVLGRMYPVRATMTLSVGIGGPSGYWSDAFVDTIFPVRERSMSITEDVRF